MSYVPSGSNGTKPPTTEVSDETAQAARSPVASLNIHRTAHYSNPENHIHPREKRRPEIFKLLFSFVSGTESSTKTITKSTHRYTGYVVNIHKLIYNTKCDSKVLGILLRNLI
jgi:hypothetical protein